MAKRQSKQKNCIQDFVDAGLPRPVEELCFAKEAMGRRWRADFAWPDHHLLVEIEGGVWTGGRHTRGVGFVKDLEKYNAATELGWRLLRYTPKRVDYEQIKRVLASLED